MRIFEVFLTVNDFKLEANLIIIKWNDYIYRGEGIVSCCLYGDFNRFN